MNLFFNALVFVLILVGCTSEKKNPEIEAITKQFQKALQSQKDLEAKIKKIESSDPGQAGFLTQDLELLKSRILAIKARGKALNGGADLFPDNSSSGGGSGH